MEEYSFNNIELNDDDKRIFGEIERLIKANTMSEAIRCINHAINGYLHKALLAVENLQNAILDTPEKQKEAFIKIIQNSLKASLVAKELRKFYHL
ncbi:MAG: hypothetical protein Q8O30_01020 [Candidatus Omnitrophota bacterium]|nr:hypothetical protein [Candidatus Omnitrophota bacterium]